MIAARGARLEDGVETLEIVLGQKMLRARFAQPIHVGRGLLLRRALAELPREDERVRRIDDHELADRLRRGYREVPRDRASPIMRNDLRLAIPQVRDQLRPVLDDLVWPVGLDIRG